MPKLRSPPKAIAIKFIILLGIVSLFADTAYEGARSITGPFLALLGASGAAVGIIAGLAEMFGYAFRFISGYVSDKTKSYWLITMIGYGLNVFAVPLLAFAGNWQVAGLLIILERFGKAIRTPARDTLISFATKQTGAGWGFGLHEFLDQIGAVLGPLLVTLVLAFQESYRSGFLVLFIPATIAMGVLTYARMTYPSPQNLEMNHRSLHPKKFTKNFWIYLSAVGLVAAGYADFALIAYHFEKAAVLSKLWIPLLYTIAMATDGLASLFIGRLFDRKGPSILASAILLSALFAPLVFFGGFASSLIGMILWGIGMGSQTTITRAIVPYLISPEHRGRAYGYLNLAFGVFWFLGSALMGILYDISITYLVVFSVVIQLASIPLFLSIHLKPPHPSAN